VSRKPRAFRLDDPEVVVVQPGEAPERGGRAVITEQPLETIEAADGVTVPMGRRKGMPWGAILFGALGLLLSLGLGLAVEELIAGLYRLTPWLGWFAAVLAALALFAFVAIVWREVAGVLREQRIETLRENAIESLEIWDHSAARCLAADLGALYGGRAGTSEQRKRLAAVADEILDAEDRLGLAERELLAPLDAQAKRAIAGAARQVAAVTALSPRAIVDVAFVVFAAAKLLRRIAQIYGGRPGTLGFLRLARAAFNHLAVTGGVAVGDSLLQQVLGLGLAARVSAKLGEGVLNGLMTARFGLAALAVCRPLPFVKEEPPRLGDVAGELLSREETQAGG
jgi:putative membrane protein